MVLGGFESGDAEPAPGWSVASVMPLLAVALVMAASFAPPVNPLDVRGAPLERVVVSAALEDPAESVDLESRMLAKLGGVMAVLKGAEAKAMRSAGPGTPPVDPVEGAERVAYLHLESKGGRKTVELAQMQSGMFVIFELNDGGARGAAVVPKQDAIGSQVARWDLFQDEVAERAAGARPAEGVYEKLDGPYFPGWFTCSQEQLGDRLLAGGKTTVKGVQRVLATQELLVRLPRGYDPRKPAGVLVYVDPDETGRLPEVFFPVLDERNLIAVGASGMGNTREISDRLQLAFDGLATVARRFHVDPSRYYVTGISGGGRLSSILAACYPDVFAGAVPVVGVACYENLPTGVGGFWAGMYRKPSAKVFAEFKKHPMAVVTGGKDMNQAEIHRAVTVFTRDGCNVKLFDWEDLRHEAPSAARLKEVFEWVDGKQGDAAKAAARSAEQELRTLEARRAGGGMDAQELAKEVRRITVMAPWSGAAWTAAGLVKTPTEAARPAPR